MERDFLGLKPKDPPGKAKAAIEALSRDEVNEYAVEAHREAHKSKMRSAGSFLTFTVGGFVVGDVISYGFKRWAASDLPLSEWARAGYPGLRTIPHGVLGAVLMFAGRDLDSRRSVATFASGLGLGVSALARLHDWVEHDGDLSADRETALQARNAELEKMVEELRRQGKQP